VQCNIVEYHAHADGLFIWAIEFLSRRVFLLLSEPPRLTTQQPFEIRETLPIEVPLAEWSHVNSWLEQQQIAEAALQETVEHARDLLEASI
jgi:hypothetical protein